MDRERWYVGTQNDSLYIIDQPPRPAPVDYLTAGPKDLQVIAKVYDTEGHKETARRANLIAAAPDLYEALEACTKILNSIRGQLDSYGLRDLDAARAALARAGRKTDG